MRNEIPKEIFINDNNLFAIELDEHDNLLYIYTLEDGHICEHSRGILKEINSIDGEKISNYFNISLNDYHVEVKDEIYSINL